MKKRNVQQEPVYLMESKSGMLVRVPESRLEAWQAAQESGEADKPLTEQERQLIARIARGIYRGV